MRIDKECDLIGNHHENVDAQTVYNALELFATEYIGASLNTAGVLTYITLARLGSNQTWVGSISAFITHWDNQVRQYNLTVTVQEDRLSKITILTLLQAAVHGIS